MNKKFENFGTALSREQMKKIMGGCGIGELCDGGDTPECGEMCNSDKDCAGGSCTKCLAGQGPKGGCGCGSV